MELDNFDECTLCNSKWLTSKTISHCPFCYQRIKKLDIQHTQDFIIIDNVLLKYTGTETEFVVPDGVTTIGKFAFESTQVKAVVLPDSLTNINSDAFSWCENLLKFFGGDNLNSIGKYAFEGCENLEHINLNNVTSIGDGAFHDCPNLETNIKNKIQSINPKSTN